MPNPFQPNLRKPWVLLCASALVIYVIVPVRHTSALDFDRLSAWLEALMFVLSFPFGGLLLLLERTPYDHGIGDRFALWGLALGLGYLNWFHLFPRLRERDGSGVTPLGLSGVPPVSFASTPVGEGLLEAHPAALEEPPVPQFNDRGQTPLERIFRDGV